MAKSLRYVDERVLDKCQKWRSWHSRCNKRRATLDEAFRAGYLWGRADQSRDTSRAPLRLGVKRVLP